MPEENRSPFRLVIIRVVLGGFVFVGVFCGCFFFVLCVLVVFFVCLLFLCCVCFVFFFVFGFFCFVFLLCFFWYPLSPPSDSAL